MRQLQKVSPQHAAKRGQAASLLLAALLLLALLISGKSSNGAGWREQWLLSALRLNTSRHGAPAAPTARPDAGGSGLALAQEKQGVEVDVIVVVEDQQAQAADARQQLQDARAGSQPKAATPADAPRPQDRQQRCAVYNGALFHSDVAAGMAWAFQEAGCNVSTYLHKDTHGMQPVMEPWFRGQHRSHTQLLGDAAQYDVIVLVTFPEHRFATQLSLLLGQHRPPPHQRLLLVTHNPDRMLCGCEVGPQEWLLDLLAEQVVHWGPAAGGGAATGAAPGAPAAGRGEGPPAAGAAAVLSPSIQFLTLAPCASDFTAAMLETWAAARRAGSISGSGGGGGGGQQPRAVVPWLAPVMPWSRSAGGLGHAAATPDTLQHLCIQGSINPHRRDYAGAFAAALHPAVLAQLRARNESLLLVGSYRGADLGIPKALQRYVRILSDLSFQDYYRTLSQCRAVLTAFSSDVYITKKASSTLAAALQVGTPVLTEDSVLAGYSYLSQGAAYSYTRPATSGPAPNPVALGAEAGAAVAALSKQEWHGLRVRCKKEGGRRHLLEGALAAASGGLASAPSSKPAGGGAAEGRHADAAPAPGSYAAALLAAFDDAANQAAHAAAWQLKEQVMQHNVRAARLLMSPSS